MRNGLRLLFLLIASASGAEDHQLVETKEGLGVAPAALSFGAVFVGDTRSAGSKFETSAPGSPSASRSRASPTDTP